MLRTKLIKRLIIMDEIQRFKRSRVVPKANGGIQTGRLG
jgi:hypothetical protein